MVFKEKYMMFCFLILTLMLLNLEDENHYSKIGSALAILNLNSFVTFNFGY